MFHDIENTKDKMSEAYINLERCLLHDVSVTQRKEVKDF